MPDDPSALREQIARLEESLSLRDRLDRLEKRVAGAPGGSPAAIPPRRQQYLIAPHPGGPSQIDSLRAEFISKGGYERM